MNLYLKCQYCGAPPLIHASGPHSVECSNLIDCPEWPATEDFPTAEEARAAWNLLNTEDPDHDSGDCPHYPEKF